MALTNPNRLINLSELNYYNTKLNTKLDNTYVKPSGVGVQTTIDGETSTTSLNFTTNAIGTQGQEGYVAPVTKSITLVGNGGSFSAQNDTLTFTVDAAAEYTIGALSTASTGAFKTYQLYKDGSAVPNSIIDIPKDFLVKSATSSVVVAADKQEGGKFENDSTYEVGDAYLDFVINSLENDATDSHVYVNVKNLVDVYTAGDGIDITNNEVSVVVDSSNANGLSVGANGLALATAINTAGVGTAGAMSGTDTLSVQAKTNGGIAVTSDGVEVQYDNSTIIYDTTNHYLKANVAVDTDIDSIFA